MRDYCGRGLSTEVGGVVRAHIEELVLAEEVAIEAGEILMRYFRSDRVGAREKGARDVVTAADLESEALVTERLRQAFPRDGIVGEEGSAVPPRANRRWYLDPLDGTLNFSRGLPIWCVSLSLFEGDQPVLGVIHDPIHHETFHAVAGQGAFRGEERLRGSTVDDVAHALVHVTVDFHQESMWQGIEDLRLLAPRVLRTRNIGSAALALAYVAAGHFDAMVHHYANPWDYGAGVALVREAGGVVTEVTGAPYTVASRGILAAAHPALHAQLLAALRP